MAQTTSLPPSELGEKLLVGRDTEMGILRRRIMSAPKLATVEGLNGVGKTSIVNVAAYKLYKEHIQGSYGSLFIPCRRPFQLNPGQNLQEFIDKVFMEVAQTLLEQSAILKSNGTFVPSRPIDRWLNSAQLKTFSGGLGFLQAGFQSETNTSAGFQQSGFRKAVMTWLEEVFPEGDGAGVICIIDNLELLQQSNVARNLLEQLRDELFGLPGLRWVLCGSLGIVNGIVSSPRLEGYLHPPLEIGEISAQHASAILESRINTYSPDASSVYLPLLPESFDNLYRILRGNLRSVLSHADNYCQWAADNGLPGTEEEKRSTFQRWLASQCASSYEAVRQELRPRAIKVFQDAEEIGGLFSPSDYDYFGFNSIAAFRSPIQALENVGLVVSTKDEGDKRRKTIQITPKGWMVLLHMATFKSAQ